MQRVAQTLLALTVCLWAPSGAVAQSCSSQCDPALQKERRECAVHDKATVASSNRRQACLRDAEKRAGQCMDRCVQNLPPGPAGAKAPPTAPAPASAAAPK